MKEETQCKIQSCTGEECQEHCPCDCHYCTYKVEDKCVCGVPTTKDVIHRKDAPCYYDFMKDAKLNECCEECGHFDYCTPKTCPCHKKIVFEFPHCCLIHKGTLPKTCDKCAYENEIKVYIYEFLKRERKDTLQAVKEMLEGMKSGITHTTDLLEATYYGVRDQALEDIKVKLDELITNEKTQ